MRTRSVLLLATVCGVAVGNVYFPQSITPAVAAGLDVPPGAAAGIVTAAQVATPPGCSCWCRSATGSRTAGC